MSDRSSDPDLPEKIYAADVHARTLQDMAHSAPNNAQFASLSYEAADAYDVAADAWEELGNTVRADIRRERAVGIRKDAFAATHQHVSHGWYRVSDMEARAILRANAVPLPKPGTKLLVRVRFGSSVGFSAVLDFPEANKKSKRSSRTLWLLNFSDP